jgi:uncharacterized protein YukE
MTTVNAPTGGGVLAPILNRYRGLLNQCAQTVTGSPEVLERAAALMRSSAATVGELGQDMVEADPGEGWQGRARDAFVAATKRQRQNVEALSKVCTSHAEQLSTLAKALKAGPTQVRTVQTQFETGAAMLASFARPGMDLRPVVAQAERFGNEAVRAATSVQTTVDAALKAFIAAVTGTTRSLTGALPSRTTTGQPATGNGGTGGGTGAHTGTGTGGTGGGSAAPTGGTGNTGGGNTGTGGGHPAPGATGGQGGGTGQDVGQPGHDGAGHPVTGHHGQVSGMPYADLFNQAAAKHGVPAALLAAVAKTESSFDPKIVSSAGAQGLMQFMPETARGLGVDPFNPASAVDGAARLLKENINRFGSVDLALAAYNAGPGAVEKYGGIPPYPETQDYVRKVNAAMREYGG